MGVNNVAEVGAGGAASDGVRGRDGTSNHGCGRDGTFDPGENAIIGEAGVSCPVPANTPITFDLRYSQA